MELFDALSVLCDPYHVGNESPALAPDEIRAQRKKQKTLQPLSGEFPCPVIHPSSTAT